MTQQSFGVLGVLVANVGGSDTWLPLTTSGMETETEAETGKEMAGGEFDAVSIWVAPGGGDRWLARGVNPGSCCLSGRILLTKWPLLTQRRKGAKTSQRKSFLYALRSSRLSGSNDFAVSSGGDKPLPYKTEHERCRVHRGQDTPQSFHRGATNEIRRGGVYPLPASNPSPAPQKRWAR